MAVVKKIGVHRVHPLFSLERNAGIIRKKYAKLAISGVLRGAMHLLALVATPLCALTILSVMSIAATIYLASQRSAAGRALHLL